MEGETAGAKQTKSRPEKKGFFALVVADVEL